MSNSSQKILVIGAGSIPSNVTRKLALLVGAVGVSQPIIEDIKQFDFSGYECRDPEITNEPYGPPQRGRKGKIKKW